MTVPHARDAWHDGCQRIPTDEKDRVSDQHRAWRLRCPRRSGGSITGWEIAGAGLDVYEIEPLPPEHPLWTMPGVLLTRMWPASDPTCKNAAPSYSSKIASVSTRGGRCTTSSTRLIGSERYRLWKSPFRPEFFARLDEEPDEAFYTMPRKVVHIDEAAIAAIKQGLPEVLPANGVVLDLLSSWRSHWPEGFPKQRLVGWDSMRKRWRTTPIWTSMSSTM